MGEFEIMTNQEMEILRGITIIIGVLLTWLLLITIAVIPAIYEALVLKRTRKKQEAERVTEDHAYDAVRYGLTIEQTLPKGMELIPVDEKTGKWLTDKVTEMAKDKMTLGHEWHTLDRMIPCGMQVDVRDKRNNIYANVILESRKPEKWSPDFVKYKRIIEWRYALKPKK